jgi:serine/threonine protein kinase
LKIVAGDIETFTLAQLSPESHAFHDRKSRPGTSDAGPNSAPRVPDYDLLRRIGHGAYGEVWLARGLTGVYRAVKIVWRHRFADTAPFEREFRGLTESMAHSLQAGQLALLHVGQNEPEGYFYYVMELADDAAAPAGRPLLDPATYVPLTLRELKVRRGRIAVTDCVGHAVGLARALAVLHERGLVHRDIKPSNVILVNGVPKLADVGLVASAAEAQTFVGTQGYLPPEGPGTPAADVFALGKVLYELATGFHHDEFPRLPTDFANPAERKALFELNEILLRACEPLPEKRYRDANAMLADLSALRAGHSPRGRRMRRSVTKLGLLVVGIAALGATAWWKFSPSPGAATMPAAQTSEARRLAAQARDLFQQIDGTRDDYKLAEDLIAQANAKDPTDGEVSAVEAQLHQQYILRHWDDTDARRNAARTATQRALRLAPRSFEARLAQAGLLADADREGEEKERQLRALRAERPHDQRVLRALATLVGRRGRFDEAIQIAEESAAMPGGDPLALYIIAGYHWISGRKAEAEASIASAIALKPFAGGAVMSVWFKVVIHGDLDGARAILERVPPEGLQEDRGAFWGYFVALLRRDADEALARLRAMPREWMDDYFYRGPKMRLAGDALAAAGRTEAAAVEWRAALQLVEERLATRPNDTLLLSHRVGLLACLGEGERANREFDVLMQMFGLDLGRVQRVPFWITQTCILLGRHSEAISQIRQTLISPGTATQAPAPALERSKPIATAAYTSRDARFYSAAILRLDPDFDPLRGELEFQRLLADFEQAEKEARQNSDSASSIDSLHGE